MELALGNLWKGYIYQSADGKKIFPVRDTLAEMELIRWRKGTVKRLQVYLVSQKPLASKTIPERNFLIRSWIPIFTGVGTNSGTIPWWMSGRLPMNVPGNTWFHMFRIIIMCWQLITTLNVLLARVLIAKIKAEQKESDWLLGWGSCVWVMWKSVKKQITKAGSIGPWTHLEKRR